MKKILLTMAAALLMGTTAMAKDVKVLVMSTSPAVEKAEDGTKIKDNLRLTAGVKRVKADLTSQKIIVIYDADKTASKNILATMKKMGYETTVISDEKAPEKLPVDGTSGASKQKK